MLSDEAAANRQCRPLERLDAMASWIVIILAALVALWLVFAAVGAVTGLLFGLLPWIIIGLVAGWLASKVVGSHYGLLGDLLAGLAGSVIGGALFSIFFHHSYSTFSLTNLLVSIVGAILVLGLVKALRRPAYR